MLEIKKDVVVVVVVVVVIRSQSKTKDIVFPSLSATGAESGRVFSA